VGAAQGAGECGAAQARPVAGSGKRPVEGPKLGLGTPATGSARRTVFKRPYDAQAEAEDFARRHERRYGKRRA